MVVRGWLYKQVSCSQSQVTLRIMLMNRRNITVQNVSVIHLLCEECSLSRLKKTKKLNSEKNSLSVCVCCDLVSSRWTWQLISSFSALKLLPLITYFIQTMMYGNKKRILRVSLLCTTLGVVQKKSITWGFFFPMRRMSESSHVVFDLQDSSGMRLWKRKWFVLSDYCLFYYKGESVKLLFIKSWMNFSACKKKMWLTSKKNLTDMNSLVFLPLLGFWLECFVVGCELCSRCHSIRLLLFPFN